MDNFYSIRKYFGFDRAIGIDHFYPEKFKKEKMVNQGIFKYTANGMYVFGLLILWIPGILYQSKAALLIALFNHLYIRYLHSKNPISLRSIDRLIIKYIQTESYIISSLSRINNTIVP